MNKKTEKQKNVFAALKKQKPKKGRGMSKPPTMAQAGTNTKLPEHTEAVAVHKTSSTRRTARISTYITDEASDMLQMLIMKIKKKEGKKPSIGEVLERGLAELDKRF